MPDDIPGILSPSAWGGALSSAAARLWGPKPSIITGQPEYPGGPQVTNPSPDFVPAPQNFHEMAGRVINPRTTDERTVSNVLLGFSEGPAMVERAASLLPAVRHGGKVYKGSNTHMDALDAIPAEQRGAAQWDGNNRGFVDERGRFLNRARAQKYAVDNQLIDPALPSWTQTAPELVAEWLKK